jgi:hypothetical protein
MYVYAVWFISVVLLALDVDLHRELPTSVLDRIGSFTVAFVAGLKLLNPNS